MRQKRMIKQEITINHNKITTKTYQKINNITLKQLQTLSELGQEIEINKGQARIILYEIEQEVKTK